MAGETKIAQTVYIGSSDEVAFGEGIDNYINPGSGYDFTVDTDGVGVVTLDSSGDLTLQSQSDAVMFANGTVSTAIVKSNVNTEIRYAETGGSSDSLKLIRGGSTTIAEFTRAVDFTPQTTLTTTTANFDTTIQTTGTGDITLNSGSDITITTQDRFFFRYNDSAGSGSLNDLVILNDATTVATFYEEGLISFDPVSGQNFNVTTLAGGDVNFVSGDNINNRASGFLTLDYNYGDGSDPLLIRESSLQTEIAKFTSVGAVEFTPQSWFKVNPISGNNIELTTLGSGDILLTSSDYLTVNASQVRLTSEDDFYLTYNDTPSTGDFVIYNNGTPIVEFTTAGQVNYTPQGSFNVDPVSGNTIDLTTTGSNAHITLTSSANIGLESTNEMVFDYDTNGSASSLALRYGTTPTNLLVCNGSGSAAWETGANQDFSVTTAGTGDIVLKSDAELYLDFAIDNVAADNIKIRAGSALTDILAINYYGSLTWNTAQHLLRYDTLGVGNYFKMQRGSGNTDLLTCTSGGAVTWNCGSGYDFDINTNGTGDININSSDDVTITYNNTSTTGDLRINQDADEVALFSAAGEITFEPTSGQDFNVTTAGAGDLLLTSGDNITITNADDFLIESGNAISLNYYNDDTVGTFNITRGSGSTSLLQCTNPGAVTWTCGEDEDYTINLSNSGQEPVRKFDVIGGYIQTDQIFNVDSSATGVGYNVNGTTVVVEQQTGWTTPTGTQNRGTFATGSVSLSELAQRVYALIVDLESHGLID